MIIFYISETFKSIRNSKLSSLLSVNTIALAVLFSLFSLFIIFYSGMLESYVKGKVEIILFVQKGLSGDKLDKIKSKISSDNYVASIRFVDEAAAAQEFKKRTGEDFTNILDENPLPASFRIKIKKEFMVLANIETLKKRFEKLDGITDVIFDYNFVLKALKFIENAKLIIYILSVILVLVSIYLVYSTNTLQMQHKMNEYQIMKLVGASLSTIKIPIYLSGLLLGGFAALLCEIILFVVITFLNKIYYQVDFTQTFIVMSSLVIALGIFFGLLGSYFSAKKISWKI